ncbi:hypothetical protein NX059_007553 [Plenodomus lindquistii]|nr:hypothetical protein NX059_007553 [Plenodomus lindquistii]
MGREAYLDKIAFGRSAFTPTQTTTESSEYVQLESSQSETPQRYLEATANNYIQLHDERGNPTNPRSRDYAKVLRSAQNDVLASVGVVQRRRSPADGLPGSYEERLELLEAEDSVGNFLSVTTELTENTYRYPVVLPFTKIVADEVDVGGSSIVYAGFPSRLVSASQPATACHQSRYKNTTVLPTLARGLEISVSITKVAKVHSLTERSFGWTLEVLLYPFSYHASLQRLGLVPATMLLPALSAFNPWSTASPLWPISTYYDVSASPIDCLLGLLTSPVVLVCAGHFADRWVYACVHEAVEASVIRPGNSNVPSRQADDKEWMATLIGRKQSPPLIRNLINRAMSALGWGRPFRDEGVGVQQSYPRVNGHTVAVGGTQVANIRPLEIPTSRNPDVSITEPIDVHVDPTPTTVTGTGTTRPATPPSPGLLAINATDNDPRIRITSREGIVEMEVRLPPRILSTHTEVAEVTAIDSDHRTAVLLEEIPKSDNQVSHRITQLSMELASMTCALTEAQLIGLAMLPLQVVTCRLIAAHFLGSCKARGILPNNLRPLLDMGDLSWASVGTQVSRIALCAALELVIDLGLWGLQYFAVTSVGQGFFGWGTL